MRKKRRLVAKERIGLFTHDQEKNTTPFQYFVHVVVGLFVVAISVVLLVHEMGYDSEYVDGKPVAQSEPWAWITAITGMVIGTFLAHAGIIFWTLRIANKISAFRRSRSHSATNHHVQDDSSRSG